MRMGPYLIAASLLLTWAAASPARAEDRPAPAAKQAPKLEFVYLEMTGVEGTEAAAITRALFAVEGVRSFAWTVDAAEAKVVREVGKATDDALLRAAKEAGAATTGVIPLAATTFTFETVLHCGGCVGSVNKAVLAIKGVKESSVSAAMTDVTVVYDTRAVKPSAVEAALAAIEKPVRPATAR